MPVNFLQPFWLNIVLPEQQGRSLLDEISFFDKYGQKKPLHCVTQTDI
jgi:hypothetical protein